MTNHENYFNKITISIDDNDDNNKESIPEQQ